MVSLCSKEPADPTEEDLTFIRGQKTWVQMSSDSIAFVFATDFLGPKWKQV